MTDLSKGPNRISESLRSSYDGNINFLKPRVFYVRSEVSTAVTKNNAVFWDIKTQFIPHRRQYASAIRPSRLIIL
jgi:hypothetical protein